MLKETKETKCETEKPPIMANSKDGQGQRISLTQSEEHVTRNNQEQ